MKTSENNGATKRTQKDYSLSFKLQLVKEVKQGLLFALTLCEIWTSQ